MSFPVFTTKTEEYKKFNLIDPDQVKEYFQFKAGKEIEKIREYLQTSGFVVYLLGKKNSGKGTYSKMFAEIVAPDKIGHFSVGDMVRDIDKELADPEKKKELVAFLEKNYRGRLPLDEILASLEGRSTSKLLPTELILTLIKREMSKKTNKALFIDGFPREMDQISYSLFFRDLIDYRDDPDFFVLIDLPTNVIDGRIKGRRICPKCKTSRNLILLPTSKIGHDKGKDEFYLMCDNPECESENIRMEQKEGDELGTAPIKDRLATDKKLIEMAFNLYGMPKVLLRNTVPVDTAKDQVDDYEITPEYSFSAKDDGSIETIETPWVVKDDDGVDSYSLLPQPVVVSLIKQIADIISL